MMDPWKSDFWVPKMTNREMARGFFSTLLPIKLCAMFWPSSSTSRVFVNMVPMTLTLNKPVHGLSAGDVAAVLNEALKLSGQASLSAKSFCPTSATLAMDAGVPQSTRQMEKLGLF